MTMERSRQPQAAPAQTGQDRDTTDVVREEGEELRQEATREAQAVAASVGEQSSLVLQEAAYHARDLAQDAKHQLHRQAENQTHQLGGALGQLGERVHALADGRPDEAGPLGQYADRIAEQVEELAGRVDRLGFDGVVDEVQRFARRRPGAFLAGAALAGFAVSRLGRGVQAAQQEQDEGPTGPADGRRTGVTPPPAAAVPPLTTTPPPTVTDPAVPRAPGVPAGPGTPAGGLSGEPLFEGGATDTPADEHAGPDVAPPLPTTTPDPLRSGQVRR
jgi:hypothetical protein